MFVIQYWDQCTVSISLYFNCYFRYGWCHISEEKRMSISFSFFLIKHSRVSSLNSKRRVIRERFHLPLWVELSYWKFDEMGIILITFRVLQGPIVVFGDFWIGVQYRKQFHFCCYWRFAFSVLFCTLFWARFSFSPTEIRYSSAFELKISQR